MIISFRHVWLEAFFVDDVPARAIPKSVEARLFRKLQLIDDATSDRDLRIPPSNHFEKLKGSLTPDHSIRVNLQYRLDFVGTGKRAKPPTCTWTTIPIVEETRC